MSHTEDSLGLAEDKELFELLKHGNYTVFEGLYLRYRDDFLKSSLFKYKQLSEQDCLDAWQDCVISFFEQVSSGRLKELSCSIKSYLYLMGYRYIGKYYNAQIRQSKISASMAELDKNEHESEASRLQFEENEILVFKQVDELPEQYRKLLLMRYVQGLSIPEIMEQMNYQSVNAVSVSLSRSLKMIKDKLINLKKL